MTAANNNDNAAVAIQPCTGADNQRWTFTDGEIKLLSTGNSKCLQTVRGSTTNAAKLETAACTGSNTQKWDYDIWTNHIKVVNTNQCIDLSGGNMVAGNQVRPILFVYLPFTDLSFPDPNLQLRL